MASTLTEQFYPESSLGGFSDIDGTVRFYTRIRALSSGGVSDESTILDVGCGRGAHCEDPAKFRRDVHNFKGQARKVIGIDVDAAGAVNPSLDEFRLIDGTKWPVEEGTVDVCIADWVMEHIPDPAEFVAECYRVLKPGGYLCVRTLNRNSYIAILAKLIPNRIHTRILKRVQKDRQEADVFPTLYRCNTVKQLKKSMNEGGFAKAVVYTIEAEPSYLGFSRLAYRLGVAYHRHAPEAIRSTILAFAAKGSAAA